MLLNIIFGSLGCLIGVLVCLIIFKRNNISPYAITSMTPSAFYSLSTPDQKQFIKDGGVIVDPEHIIKRTRKAKAAPTSIVDPRD